MPIDYSKYPPNWKTEIRPAVLLRENNCCKFCGLPNKAIVESLKVKGKVEWRLVKERSLDPRYLGKLVKVVLTIAHLDHDEDNHNVALDRLAALCQLCHLRYDAQEKIRRSKINH